MEIKITKEQGMVPVTIVEVNGRVNLGNAEELEQKIRNIYEEGGANLILDLSGVPSITSAGLRAILAIYKLYSGSGSERSTLTAAGAKTEHFVLLQPSPEVLKVIQIAGFDRYLEIYDHRQEAVGSFR